MCLRLCGPQEADDFVAKDGLKLPEAVVWQVRELVVEIIAKGSVVFVLRLTEGHRQLIACDHACS